MNEEELPMCKYCNSVKVIKWGIRSLQDGGKVQTYFCGNCRRKFTVALDEKLSTQQALTEGLIPEAILEQIFIAPDGQIPPLPIENYGQKWPAYNQAQTQEKLLFMELLEDLASLIPENEERRRGRPSPCMRDMLYACVIKVYEGLSYRRAHSDIDIARSRGYLPKTPHYNTISKFLRKPEMAPLLTALVRISAMPLSGFEDTIAVDGSGLSSAFYSRWLDYRFGKNARIRDWLKIHIAVGVKSGIVTAIKVTDGKASDSPQFPALVQETAEGFSVETVCADKGYSSRNNLQVAWDLGIAPFIDFKSSTTGKKLGSIAWRKMFHYYQYNREQFMAVYHQRSNVESAFSSLKRKFNGKLFSKTEAAQVNEALAKILCHNIVVLIHESFENNVPIDIQAAAHKLPLLTTK
ncbi:transposase [Candidatus Micrarchaeota archaeon]|nr:transposase [Candidatus Micrarchaeota archaeon]